MGFIARLTLRVEIHREKQKGRTTREHRNTRPENEY